MKEKIKTKWETWNNKMAPPGFSAGPEWLIYIIGLAAAIVFSFSFLWRYYYALKLLDKFQPEEVLYQPGMPYLFWEDVLGNSMLLFYVLAIVVLAYIVRRFLYFFQESKSIYTMRRLGKPRELFKRVLLQPLLMLLVLSAIAGVLLLIYYMIYQSCPPEQYVTPEQWMDLWY